VTGSAANPQLVQPFPAPGQLVALAYRELERAANGSPEQIRALGDARLLPRPWEPASCSTPQLRQQLWCWLEEVVEWLVAEYAAERLGIGRTVMYALVGSGAVESVQIGRLQRVPADALVTSWKSSEPSAEGVRRETPIQRTLNDLPGQRWLLARSGDSRRHRSREAGPKTCHVTI
jgi:excisionase family DNA binding protein